MSLLINETGAIISETNIYSLSEAIREVSVSAIKNRVKHFGEYMTKSGTQHAFIDVIPPTSTLVLFGTGNDSEVLFDMAGHLGWSEGMASSIRSGLEKSLELIPSMKLILYFLSDQAYISSDVIQSLIDNLLTGSQLITACTYKDNIGVPAIFDKSLFPELLTLKGDTGAKKIMMQHRKNVQTIPFDGGAFDVDTKDDVNKLTTINQQ